MSIKAFLFTAFSFLPLIGPTHANASEPSNKQVSIAMSLAGSIPYQLAVRDKCKLGVQHKFDCEYKGFFLQPSASDEYTVDILVQDGADENTQQMIMRAIGGLLYVKGTLTPDEVRRWSIKFAEAMLDRDLTTLDPNNPDSFYDPRDLSVGTQLKRVGDKLLSITKANNCQTVACDAFGYFIRQTSDDFTEISLNKFGEDWSPILWFRYGRQPMIDATVLAGDNQQRIRSLVAAVLGTDTAAIKFDSFANWSEATPPANETLKASQRATTFVKDKSCVESKVFSSKEAPCRIGPYFVQDNNNGTLLILDRSVVDRASPLLYIRDGKPLMRAFLYDNERPDYLVELVRTLNADTEGRN